MRERKRLYLGDSFRATPDHGAIDRLRHRLMQIGARMIEAGQKYPLGQQAAAIDLMQLFHDQPCGLDQPARHTYQTTVSSEQGARQR